MSAPPQAHNNKITPLSNEDAKWISLNKIDWTDRSGVQRTWETATRHKRNSIGVDAVAITPILLHPSRPAATLIILQYRPPIARMCVEFPAGLIDADETVAEAAVREMREETGYDGQVKEVLPPMANDPGMSASNMQMAIVEVQLKEEDEEGVMPEQHLDDGEDIERIVVPLSRLYDKLIELTKQGMLVDSRLFHWAHGLRFAIQYDKSYGLSGA